MECGSRYPTCRNALRKPDNPSIVSRIEAADEEVDDDRWRVFGRGTSNRPLELELLRARVSETGHRREDPDEEDDVDGVRGVDIDSLDDEDEWDRVGTRGSVRLCGKGILSV